MRKQEQAAIEAVAKQFSATWTTGEGPPEAYISMAGKRVAVEIMAIKLRIVGRDGAAKPRLRLDRVVLRLVAQLQSALREFVPEGSAVIVTVTAPIRLPAKTAAALENSARACLARRSATVHQADTIHGNQTRIRVVKSSARGAAKVIGLVHNPDTDADMLLDMTQSLLQQIGAAAERRRPGGERWLVLAVEGGPSLAGTYRQIYGQLGMATVFAKILIVFAGGRVETLVS